MKQEEEKSVGLPDNAFRPLKPGEQYHPIMSPNKKISRSKPMVCAMGYRHGGIILGGRSLPGIKSGTGFEAAIPIAIIAVGVSGAGQA